ncbi:MAG: hypothetical protein WCY71_08990 [Halothiobacillaceae bacterium]
MKGSIISVAGAILLTVGLAVPLSATAQQMGADAPIYGSELMTQQERLEYRDRLRATQTPEERERIRNEHHQQMQERARDQGVSLPASPPRDGTDMGSRGMTGDGYDGRQRLERQQMEDRGRMQGQQREHRDRMPSMDGSDHHRGSGMGGRGGGRQ